MFCVADSRPPQARASLLLAGAWLALTLPMLTLGYGSDVDAWLVAQRAHEMWATGVYARSRSTGFPLYEIAVTPLVIWRGWLASNAVACISGLAMLGLMHGLARLRALTRPALSAGTLLFMPIIVKNATATMDYLPAMALLLGAYVALHQRRWWLCCVLIGLACGVRPTSGLFVIPVAAATVIDTRDAVRAGKMVLLASAVGLLAFYPALRLGPFGIAPVTTTINGLANGVRLVGLAQAPWLFTLLAWSLWRDRGNVRSANARSFETFHLVNIAVWTLQFLALPGEPEYLLPMTLSIVLLIDRHASTRAAVSAACLLCSFHVVAVEVQGSSGGQRARRVFVTGGLTMRDVEDRRFKLWLRSAANTWHGDQPLVYLEQVLPVIVGEPDWRWTPDLNVYRRIGTRLAVGEVNTDAQQLLRLRQAGYDVVAWRIHEWEYAGAERRDAHALVRFVDEPGAVLGVRRVGVPFSLAGPIR